MRLFLHMPKCAGSSIKPLLETHCANEIILDYDNFFKIPKYERAQKVLNWLNHPTFVSKNHFVFGHFFPIKYIGDKSPADLQLVTILREPLERLISHYYFWNNGDYSDHYLWRKMKENKWTLSQFIMSDEMQNFYDQYMWHCPLKFFSYIGIYENLVESTRKCLQNIGLSVDFTDIPHINSTPNRLSGKLQDSFIKEALEFHKKDYLIYNYAIEKFHPLFKTATPQP